MLQRIKQGRNFLTTRRNSLLLLPVDWVTSDPREREREREREGRGREGGREGESEKEKERMRRKHAESGIPQPSGSRARNLHPNESARELNRVSRGCDEKEGSGSDESFYVSFITYEFSEGKCRKWWINLRKRCQFGGLIMYLPETKIRKDYK